MARILNGLAESFAAIGTTALRSYILPFVLVATVVAGLCLLLMPKVQGVREAARRWQCKNNLKQIAAALHAYHEKWGSFPPPVVYDADGRPAHSWRVLILPFIEEGTLYQQYRFDEPWNGPNNSKLAQRIPITYRCPSFSPGLQHSESATPHLKELTNYVAVVSPDAIFHRTRITSFKEISDGKSNTILIAETWQHAVHWMQPRDVSPQEIFSDLHDSRADSRAHHVGGLHFALADGSVRFINSGIDLRVFFALITRDGKEAIPDY